LIITQPRKCTEPQIVEGFSYVLDDIMKMRAWAKVMLILVLLQFFIDFGLILTYSTTWKALERKICCCFRRKSSDLEGGDAKKDRRSIESGRSKRSKEDRGKSIRGRSKDVTRNASRNASRVGSLSPSPKTSPRQSKQLDQE